MSQIECKWITLLLIELRLNNDHFQASYFSNIILYIFYFTIRNNNLKSLDHKDINLDLCLV